VTFSRLLPSLSLLALSCTSQPGTSPNDVPKASTPASQALNPATANELTPSQSHCDVSHVEKVAREALAQRKAIGSVIVLGLADHNDEILVNVGTSSAQAISPASTVKSYLSWIALHDSSIDAEVHETCEGSFIAHPGGPKIECHAKHGELDLRLALATSCNFYFYKLAERIGAQRLAAGLEKLGLRGYADQIRKSASDGIDAYLATATGHHLAKVTPLEAAHAYAVLARDKSSAGLSLREKMLAVVEDERGTGRSAAVDGLSIAGKTGSAEDENGRTDAWFNGYAPAENPNVVVVVHLQDQGYSVAASEVAHLVFEAWRNSCQAAAK
jgi:cell division protein FtsI/penicillin-binding protein 2